MVQLSQSFFPKTSVHWKGAQDECVVPQPEWNYPIKLIAYFIEKMHFTALSPSK